MSEPMTQRELGEIRAKAEKIAANKRPQFAVLFSQERDTVLNDVPRILDEVARLRAENAGLRAELEVANKKNEELNAIIVNMSAYCDPPPKHGYWKPYDICSVCDACIPSVPKECPACGAIMDLRGLVPANTPTVGETGGENE